MQRRVAGAGEVFDAGVGLVGEREVGVGALKRSLLLSNDFSACADENIGELGLCDVNAGLGLAQFRDKFGVVDLKQQLPGFDVLAALDGTLAHSPIDPRGDVDAGRIRFALDDQRLEAAPDTRSRGRQSRRG